MRLEIEREPLVTALGRLSPIAAGSKNLPILSNVYLRAGNSDQNDYVGLDATDLETYMKVLLTSCRVIEPGGVCLDAKKFFEIAKTMTGDQIILSTNANNRAEITCDKSSFNLNGLDGADFPPWIEDDESMSISIPKLTLTDAINKVAFAALTDDSRFNLNAVLWEVQEGSLRMIATDGHRMALTFEVALVLSDDMKLMVPRKSMGAIRKFIDKTASPIEIQVCKKHITIYTENSTLGCRLLDGDYPDYTKVIPTSPGQVAIIDRRTLLRSLALVRLMTRDGHKGVELALSNNTMTASASHPDLGTAQDSTPVDYDGPELNVIANVDYLIDGLNVIEAESVQLEYFKEGAPIIFRPVGEKNYLNLVMPMRK